MSNYSGLAIYQNRHVEFGVQRFNVKRRASRDALQEMLESRRVSQIAEVECLTGQVANASGDYAKQPCIYVNLRSVQAGNIKD